MKKVLFIAILVGFFDTCLANEIKIYYNKNLSQVEFAVNEIEIALTKQGHVLKRFSYNQIPSKLRGNSIFLFLKEDTFLLQQLKLDNNSALENLKDEGFSLQVMSNASCVVANDAAGLLYGGLELAEQISIVGINNVKPVTQNPYMEMRGTKFNIPLDVRTPSYTDMSDTAQQNIAEMWNMDFWKEYIDNLARYRYNYISLWNLHPFPSMVKVPKYSEVALNDVQQSTTQFKEMYPLTGNGYDAPEILDNVKILKSITIDEKIDFWRKVMAYGKSRNVDFYIVTWNIFTNGTFGKYGITDHFDNEITTDYFRKSVEQLVLTYPDLAGVGLTTGENFNEANFVQREDWAYNTYAKGVLDALEKQPDRKITFIHRQHQTGALDIADKFKPLIDNENINFIYSFKYAKAHVYSSTKQNYHENFVSDIKDRGDLKTIWTLRNDDIFYFKWGSPNFVREFIKNIPYDVSLGYYYGSDQYVWGREFLSLVPETPRQIEIVKHWYQWMLWGRLGYNPNLDNTRFTEIISIKYPNVNAKQLFDAWQDVSLIYPLTTGFHWGALDFQWYIEACQSISGAANTPSGFHDINRFISLPPHPESNNISIPNYVKSLLSNKEMNGITPVEVYNKILAYSNSAIKAVETMPTNGDKELALTINDILTIGYLGNYYGLKIQAAIDWQLFLETGNLENKKKVEKILNEAVYYWRLYASTASAVNSNPLWTNRVGYVDWKDQFSKGVLYDLTVTGSAINPFNFPITKGGTILEAEQGIVEEGTINTEIKNFTGSGYVEKPQVTLNYEAPNDGYYIVEIRYGMKAWVKQQDIPILINNKEQNSLQCYATGGENNWVWDRLVVKLIKGNNTIHLKAGSVFRLDHINVIPFYE
ncbi:carbohydrate-binding family 6 protein [Lutibacter sp. HS1-25]|uniref:carbohydrate-binding family 6 protein n=1 Tax=Lutibacter sp. HS1-25 TaxID=2485000 RepID=UPI001012AA23|nr:carbohydrate-binding family 6 protein [Lutibacter sp. HS1-25]RXP62697.1 carbohydrate-binding family 6 protein [Lutibacter sp. HS1-25]